MKKTNTHILFLFLILITACSPKVLKENVQTEQQRWEQHVAQTEIIRDDFGVPHIYGKTDADAVFGLLFAQCEDDFNRVESNYITAIGRQAEVYGETALYDDLRANLFMTKEEAIANYEKSPKWLQDLCIAFADGVNYYLQTHPEVKPKLLTHFEPWMPMYFSEGSIGGDIERISPSKIKDFYKKDSHNRGATRKDANKLKDNEPRGSNGFAVSGALTKSGNAMLLINPHTSFFFRGEVHMVSEQGLNAYGAVTWGQFFVYQGFNEKNGWMHTSTGTDIMDEFEETIVKKEGKTSYKYGDELRSMDSLKVTLNYKSGGNLKGKTFMMYRTHHGPITHANGDKWVATAMMWSPIKALEQSYTRTKTSNYDQFYKTMDLRTNSSNNTVYADANGTIAYYHGNFIPKRNEKFDYTKPIDGSNPETDWNGLHALKDNILVKNPPNGWIQNCNSTPFTCAAEFSPKKEDYPGYMTSFSENFRGIHAIALLKKAENLTLDGLIDLAYDSYLPAAEILVNGILEAAETSTNVTKEAKEAITLLKNWNYRVSANSIEMTLTHYYVNTYLRSDQFIATMRKVEKRNFESNVDYMSKMSNPKERLEIFQTALENLTADFGSWKTQWGEFNRYQRNDGAIFQEFDDSKPSIPIGMGSGTMGALASFGTRMGKNTKRQYGTSGNSFVAVVEFGAKVKAKSMLAGGQSGDPNSPHFADQAQRYADAKFKDVAFYREDVEKRALKTYKLGRKK